jgi:hypothetical protein
MMDSAVAATGPGPLTLGWDSRGRRHTGSGSPAGPGSGPQGLAGVAAALLQGRGQQGGQQQTWGSGARGMDSAPPSQGGWSPTPGPSLLGLQQQQQRQGGVAPILMPVQLTGAAAPGSLLLSAGRRPVVLGPQPLELLSGHRVTLPGVPSQPQPGWGGPSMGSAMGSAALADVASMPSLGGWDVGGAPQQLLPARQQLLSDQRRHTMPGFATCDMAPGQGQGGQAGGGGGLGGDLWRAMRATTGDLALPGGLAAAQRGCGSGLSPFGPGSGAGCEDPPAHWALTGRGLQVKRSSSQNWGQQQYPSGVQPAAAYTLPKRTTSSRMSGHSGAHLAASVGWPDVGYGDGRGCRGGRGCLFWHGSRVGFFWAWELTSCVCVVHVSCMRRACVVHASCMRVHASCMRRACVCMRRACVVHACACVCVRAGTHTCRVHATCVRTGSGSACNSPDVSCVTSEVDDDIDSFAQVGMHVRMCGIMQCTHRAKRHFCQTYGELAVEICTIIQFHYSIPLFH